MIYLEIHMVLITFFFTFWGLQLRYGCASSFGEIMMNVRVIIIMIIIIYLSLSLYIYIYS